MTPKEKANELVDKYYMFNHIGNKHAIKCALIAVDEMLNNAGFIWGGSTSELGLSARDEYRKYWNEVKTEIEKL